MVVPLCLGFVVVPGRSWLSRGSGPPASHPGVAAEKKKVNAQNRKIRKQAGRGVSRSPAQVGLGRIR